MLQLAVVAAMLSAIAANPSSEQVDTQPARGPEQWVAVVAPGLRSTTEPLIAYRRSQGMHVVVINSAEASGDDPLPAKRSEQLRKNIWRTCKDWSGRTYVLLVGAVTAEEDEADGDRYVVPALSGTVADMTGKPTDNGYGCLDDGLLPTVAVGRFPARTADETRDMVEKTLAWEKDRRPGDWKRRITVLAGTPSFNLLADAVVERLAVEHLGAVSPAWSMRTIYRNPKSSFCVPEDALVDTATRYLRQGQTLIMYLGHSGADGFWLDREFWSDVDIPLGAGVFMTVGCHGCQLSGSDGEGYGVHAIRSPRGPVAVIGAHEAAGAAMSMLMCEALLRGLPGTLGRPRLGEIWLAMKRHLAEGFMPPLVFHALNSLDGSPATPEDVQRREHLEMYMLLGDPAIRLPSMTTRIRLTASGPAFPGQSLEVTVQVDADLENAAGILTLERPRASRPVGLQRVPADASENEQNRILVANHERSNRVSLAEKTIKLEGRVSRHTLEVPSNVPWPKLYVRLYAATDDSEGIGVATADVGPDSAQSAPMR